MLISVNLLKKLRKLASKPDSDTPILSHLLMSKYAFPLINDKSPLFFILIDNLRYDQWKILEVFIQDYFQVERENTIIPFYLPPRRSPEIQYLLA